MKHLLITSVIWFVAAVVGAPWVYDIVVIGRWRPRFLNLTDTMDMHAIQEHVVKTFRTGWLFMVPLAVIPSALFALPQ